jgi:hypothetical protein
MHVPPPRHKFPKHALAQRPGARLSPRLQLQRQQLHAAAALVAVVPDAALRARLGARVDHRGRHRRPVLGDLEEAQQHLRGAPPASSAGAPLRPPMPAAACCPLLPAPRTSQDPAQPQASRTRRRAIPHRPQGRALAPWSGAGHAPERACGGSLRAHSRTAGSSHVRAGEGGPTGTAGRRGGRGLGSSACRRARGRARAPAARPARASATSRRAPPRRGRRTRPRRARARGTRRRPPNTLPRRAGRTPPARRPRLNLAALLRASQAF